MKTVLHSLWIVFIFLEVCLKEILDLKLLGIFKAYFQISIYIMQIYSNTCCMYSKRMLEFTLKNSENSFKYI